MKTIKITTRNNSDARSFGVLDDVDTATTRHNGGKVVIAHVSEGHLEEAIAALEASPAVAQYEVRE